MVNLIQNLCSSIKSIKFIEIYAFFRERAHSKKKKFKFKKKKYEWVLKNQGFFTLTFSFYNPFFFTVKYETKNRKMCNKKLNIFLKKV